MLDLIDNVFFQNLKENERRNSDAVFGRPVTCQLDTFRKQFVVGAIPETGSWGSANKNGGAAGNDDESVCLIGSEYFPDAFSDSRYFARYAIESANKKPIPRYDGRIPTVILEKRLLGFSKVRRLAEHDERIFSAAGFNVPGLGLGNTGSRFRLF